MVPTDPKGTPQLTLRERFWKRWFPPAAAVGGLAALVAAALRVRPAPRAHTSVGSKAPAPAQGPTPPTPESAPVEARGPARGRVLSMASPQAMPPLERQYAPVAAIGRTPSSPPFRQWLSGVATGPSDQVYALGDSEIRVFDSEGRLLRQWRVADSVQCFGVGPDGRVYSGGAGRVEIFGPDGRRSGGFSVGAATSPASLTAVRVAGADILVADASARIIRRFDAAGRPLGLIGDRSKTKSFILPNGYLDVVVDAENRVYATDTGRHQVTTWSVDGTPTGRFGKFGMTDPADFVGCCNPVNLAVTPDGKIVTAEKMIARVKVFEPGGKLIAFIGPEHFDQMATHIHLAVDSKGRILAADPVRREITIFSLAAPSGRLDTPPGGHSGAQG